ncbi:HTH_Tnp_Tc3_2 domain-containing protein [Trichonephila clavipes]|nr:HTH_Tnp_Tc3_2 domain-containing protein [Trichonephila clavipes]
MSFTRRPGSERPRQRSRLEDRHIVRNARVQPTASSAAIHALIAPSLRAPVSSQTIRKHLAEGHLRSRHPLRVMPFTPTHQCLRLEWCRARGTGLHRNGTRSSFATNPDSISTVMTIMFVSGAPW